MRRFGKAALAGTVFAALAAAGCGGGSSPTSPTSTTSSSTTTTTTTTTGAASIAYAQDVKPILDADCTRCHGGSRPSAGINLSTYAGVMAVVQAGNASSLLVRATQSNGLMYGYLSGDRAGKSTLIRNWVVNNAAAQSR